VDTLRGDGLIVLGVTTLGGNGAMEMYCVRIVVCDLVCRDIGMGDFKTGVDDSERHGRWKTVGGAAGGVGDGVFRSLSLKIAANSARAEMVSSLTRANGTSRWGFCKASVMSFASMINMLVDDTCGI
jgi:hypothetical protein